MSDLVSYLFETNAVKICPENKPFWYTSGKIGPYYINTHFVYGSEKDANELLAFIDAEKENKAQMPKKVFDKTEEQYKNNEIYKTVIDEMISFIESNISIADIDFISGGERRDWFFSYMIAKILNKPHITIYKDLDVIVTDQNFTVTPNASVSGKKVLHIADLITEASSYLRAWIPAVSALGGSIVWSVVVVDRMQGGSKKLEDAGVKAFSMVNIDPSLFTKALDRNIITSLQFDMLNQFFQEPDATMRDFLLAHPEFLENSFKADEKTASRAQLCLDTDWYHLDK